MRAQMSATATGRCCGGPLTSPAGCPVFAPDGVRADRPKPDQVQSTEEFLCRFGDAIDDRVAEILDERDAQRPRPQPRPGSAAAALLLAVTATIVLRHAAVAVAAVWLSTAAICLTAWAIRPRRP